MPHALERQFRSQGVLITSYTNKPITEKQLKRVLHENITTRLFVAGVTEHTRAQGTSHIHVLAFAATQRRWVMSNLLAQLKVTTCQMKPIDSTWEAVNTLSYMCKEATPMVWAPHESTVTRYKKWTVNHIWLMQAKWRKANFRRESQKQLEQQMTRLVADGWDPIPQQ